MEKCWIFEALIPNNRAHTRRSFHVVGVHEQQPHFNNGRGRIRGDRDWTTSPLSTLQIRQGSIQTQNDSLLDNILYYNFLPIRNKGLVQTVESHSTSLNGSLTAL